MKLPLCFFAASGVALAQWNSPAHTEARLRFELETMQWQMLERERDLRAQQRQHTYTPCPPVVFPTPVPMREAARVERVRPAWVVPQFDLRGDLINADEIPPHQRQQVATNAGKTIEQLFGGDTAQPASPAPQPQWVLYCQLPSGMTINQRVGYTPPTLTHEEFMQRWNASWQRVYAQFPSLADETSPMVKELDAYVERTSRDPAIAPLFYLPEWPEVIVREFGIERGVLAKTTPPPPFLMPQR